MLLWMATPMLAIWKWMGDTSDGLTVDKYCRQKYSLETDHFLPLFPLWKEIVSLLLCQTPWPHPSWTYPGSPGLEQFSVKKVKTEMETFFLSPSPMQPVYWRWFFASDLWEIFFTPSGTIVGTEPTRLMAHLCSASHIFFLGDSVFDFHLVQPGQDKFSVS